MDGSNRHASADRSTKRTMTFGRAAALVGLIALVGCGGGADDGSLGSPDGHNGLSPDSLLHDGGDSTGALDATTDGETGPAPEVDSTEDATGADDGTTLADSDDGGADDGDAGAPLDGDASASDGDTGDTEDADAVGPEDADAVGAHDADVVGPSDADVVGPEDADAVGPADTDADGDEPAPVCEPGATDCDGGTLLTCAADGSGWESTPCDDGAPCTVDGCEAGACTFAPAPAGLACDGDSPCEVYACDDEGACVAKGDRLWSRPYDLAAVDVAQTFRDVVALQDGGFMVAASCPGCDETVVRLDAIGDVLWKKSYEAGQLGWLSRGPSGGYAVRTSDGQIHRADEAMDHEWTVAPGTSIGDMAFGLPSPTIGGGVLAPGYVDEQDSAFTDGALIAVGADGLPDWVQSYGDAGVDERLVVALELSDGSIVAGGRVGSVQATSHDMWLVRLHADGQLQWQQTYAAEGGAGITRLAAHPDGGFVLAGSWQSGPADTERRVRIVRTDAFGFPIWQKWLGTPETPGYEALSDMVVLPGGDIAVLDGGAPNPRLARLDAWGNVQWEEIYSDGKSLDALGHAPGGGFVLAGSTWGSTAFSQDEAWLVRTDPWGHASCSEAGPCAAETIDSCADGNPCTADVCTVADGGCTSEPIEDAGACGAEDVCVAATCVPSPCDPGATLCHDDGGGFLLCQPDGEGWTSVSCASDETCEGGTCTAPE
ncbi:MAG: hypothetical protein ACQEXJ_24070 [Myxococcota bacterium]